MATQEETRGGLQAALEEVQRLRDAVEAVRLTIVERQAAWDAKFAEYNEMLQNSGGQLNRAGRAKVAKLDAEARAIKAEIDAAREQLKKLEAELEEAEEAAERERIKPLLEESDGAEEGPGDEPPQDAPTGSSFGGVTGKRAPSEGGAPAARPGGRLGGAGAQGSSTAPSAAPTTPPSAGSDTAPSSVPSGTPSLLSEKIPIIDPWDPVGGMTAGTAQILRWPIVEKFGRLSRADSPSVELVRFSTSGHRLPEPRAGSFGVDPHGPRPDSGYAGREKQAPVYIESAREELIRLDQDRLVQERLGAPIVTGDGGQDRSDTYAVICRVESSDAGAVAEYFHTRGSSIGKAVYEYEMSGDVRRPIAVRVEEQAVIGFRLNDFDVEETTIAVHRWEYRSDGRLAAFESANELREAEVKAQLDMLRAQNKGMVEVLEKQLRLSTKDAERWAYEYDGQGRLKRVVKTRTTHQIDPAEVMEKAPQLAQSDPAMLRLLEAQRMDPELLYRNEPNDGITIEKKNGGRLETAREEVEFTEWDARGRWTKGARFEVDEAGKVEQSQFERTFFDQDPAAPALDGSFQIIPASRSKAGAAFGSRAAKASTQDGSEGASASAGGGAASEDSPAETTDPDGSMNSSTKLMIAIGAALAVVVIVIAVVMSSKRRNRRGGARQHRSGAASDDDPPRGRAGMAPPPPAAPLERGGGAPAPRAAPMAGRPVAAPPAPPGPSRPQPTPTSPVAQQPPTAPKAQPSIQPTAPTRQPPSPPRQEPPVAPSTSRPPSPPSPPRPASPPPPPPAPQAHPPHRPRSQD